MPRPLKIAVIDDDATVAETIGLGLRRRGDTVLFAHTVKEAWALLEGHDGGFDRALIDLTLQDGDGLDLATAIHLRYPAIGIILTSGGGYLVAADFGVMQKPFTLDQLWAAIA
jgi:two-component system response regulator RegA